MDCHSVRERIFAFLDGEAAEEDIQDLEVHFQACIPCYQRLTLQKALGKLVRARVRGSAVPSGMEARLRMEIHKRARAEGRAPLLDRPLVWLSAAAAIFLAVGLTAALNVTPPAQAGSGPPPAAAFHPIELEGVLVCLACDWARTEGREQQCTHQNSLRTDGGRVFHFLENEATRAIVHEPSMAGRHVRIRGYLDEPSGLLDVKQVYGD